MASAWHYRLRIHGDVEHTCGVTLAGETLQWRMEPVDPDDEDGEKSACDQKVEDFRKFGPPEAPEFLRVPPQTLDAICAGTGTVDPRWRQPLPPEVARLFAAAERGDIEAMNEILRGGVDVNVQDSHGRTALWRAAEKPALAACEWLADHGADLDVPDRYGATLLMRAAFRNEQGLADFLRLRGADLGLRDRTGRTAWLQGIESRAGGLIVSFLRAHTETDWPRALHIAAQNSNVHWLEGEDWFVESRKLEMNTREGYGRRTPLQKCLRGYRPLWQAASWLVGNGADLTAVDEEDGATLLHLAAQQNLPWMVPACQRAGVKIDALDHLGNTALSRALDRNERPRLVMALLEAGADPGIEVPCQPRGQEAARVSVAEKARRMGLLWSHWLLTRTSSPAWSGLCCYARLEPEGDPPMEDGDPPKGSIWLEFPAEWCAAKSGTLSARLLAVAGRVGPGGSWNAPQLLSQEEALGQPGGWPGRKFWAVFPDETTALLDRFRDERPREIVADPDTFRDAGLDRHHRAWAWQDRAWDGDWVKFRLVLRHGLLTWTGGNCQSEQNLVRFRFEGPPRGADFFRTVPDDVLDEVCALLGDTKRSWETWLPPSVRAARLEQWKAENPQLPPPLAPAPPPHHSGKWCYARLDIEDHFTTPSGAGSDGEWSCWLEFPAEWCYCQRPYLTQWLTAALLRAYAVMSEKSSGDRGGGHYAFHRCWPVVLTRAEASRQPWTERGKVLYSIDDRECPPLVVPDEEKRRPLADMGDPAHPPQPLPISPPPLPPNLPAR